MQNQAFKHLRGVRSKNISRSYRHIPNNDRRIVGLDPRNVSYNYIETTRESDLQSPTLLTCRVRLSSKSMVKLNLALNDKDIITCSALVDSGSHVNMISVSQLKSLRQLGAIDVENVEAEAEELIGLGDNAVPVQYCCYLKLNFGINQPFIRIKFHVIHEKNLDLVLGRQFLGQTNALLNFHENEMLLQYTTTVNNSQNSDDDNCSTHTVYVNRARKIDENKPAVQNKLNSLNL